MASPAPIARRSFSLPISRSASAPDPTVEVLYNLPSVRIVAFTTPNSAIRPGSSSSSGGSPIVSQEPGTLPWSSRFERTIAVGPLRIYRAPGSVAFLNCANALQPILPKSQCWYNGDSQFVLQIRRPQYWRIEVPSKTTEDKTIIEELKGVLSQVLLFEKTPCPFQRDFIVQLPELPQTPVAKRPWKPTRRQDVDISPSTEDKCSADCSLSSILDSPLVPITSTQDFHTPSKTPPGTRSRSPSYRDLHSFSTASPTKHIAEVKEIGLFPAKSPDNSLSESLSPKSLSKVNIGILEEDSGNFSDTTDYANITPRNYSQPKFQPILLELAGRPNALQPVLSLVTSPPSKQRTESPRDSAIAGSDSDFSSSVDSFHSIQSWHSPLEPPSPHTPDPLSPETYPYPHDNVALPKYSHTRDTSELTLTPETPETPGVWVSSMDTKSRSLPSPPKTPTLVNDAYDKSDDEQFEVVTPPTIRPTIRHRATTSSNSRRRELSPLPAAVNLFSPPRRRSRRLQTARHLPTAIIQKTCEILLSPPSHLLHLMLNIASKIAAGEWHGFLSGYGESVHWDFEDEYAEESWTEDDYGTSLPDSKRVVTKGNTVGGSWEID